MWCGHKEHADGNSDPKHPVGMDAAKIRLHQRIGKQGSVDSAHAAPDEDVCDLSRQQTWFDASLSFRFGVSGHRLLLRSCSQAFRQHDLPALTVRLAIVTVCPVVLLPFAYSPDLGTTQLLILRWLPGIRHKK